MCLMQTDFPVPDGPRIIEILSSGMPRLRPRRILLRPNALWTSTNSTASWTPVGRCLPVCQRYSSSSGAPAARPAGVLGRRLGSSPRARRPLGRAGPALAADQRGIAFVGHCGQPPMGARGFAPQKIWVPSMPIRCTSTMLSTIDFAVAVPTPTGPPLAV